MSRYPERLSAHRLSRRLLLLAAPSAFWRVPPVTIAQTADVPEIAAAADLKYALSEIAAAFAKRTGRQVKLTFGSSGDFATRIEQGASFEMFLSADEGYVQRLNTEGKTEGCGAVYAIGRIGIFAAKGSVLTPDSKLADLAAALADGRLRKFAIAMKTTSAKESIVFRIR